MIIFHKGGSSPPKMTRRCPYLKIKQH